MWIVALFSLGFLPLTGLLSQAWAGTELVPNAAPPGATVTIAGKGFGQFKSTQENRVLFNGTNAGKRTLSG